MKTFLLGFFLICASTNLYSQDIDTTDIFMTNKEGFLILKPEIEKKINNKIESRVKLKLENFKKLSAKNFEYYDNANIADEYEFAKDTIRINEFFSEYNNSYLMSSTTMGMNWKASSYLQEFDKLLIKYYQKAQTVLQHEGRKKLLLSQRKWLEYYNNERDFISSLNDFGNHNSSMYNWGYFQTMMENRIQFLRDIYNKNFEGSFIFKE